MFYILLIFHLQNVNFTDKFLKVIQIHYIERSSRTWALTTADDSARIVIMHSGDDLFFPDTNLPWWYQCTEFDELQLDHSMKAFKIDIKEENNVDVLRSNLFLYQEKQDDKTVDKAIDKIVIIFVIGASLVFLMVSALTITVLVRRQALKEKMRQIIPDNNPVYGENFYYEDSTVTDINDCYD